MVPSGSFGSADCPPVSSVAVPGMLKAIQCVTSSVFFPIATSGSCMSSTKVTVPAGTFFHSSLGETGLGSACVNLLGITPPSSKSGDESASPGGAGPLPLPPPPGPPPGGGPCPKAVPMPAASRMVPNAIVVLIIFLPSIRISISKQPIQDTTRLVVARGPDLDLLLRRVHRRLPRHCLFQDSRSQLGLLPQ